MPNITNDNLTGKDVMLDIGLSDSDTKMLGQMIDLMQQLLPMVKDTTEALGKVMNSSHESFSSVRSDLDQHSSTAKKVTDVQLDMRDAVSETIKGVDSLARSTAKLTEAMAKYGGVADEAAKSSRRVKDSGGDEDEDAFGDEPTPGSRLGVEGRMGSVRDTKGMINKIMGESGKSQLKSMVGNVFGKGVVGQAVGELAMNALKSGMKFAGPVTAALAVSQLAQNAVELKQQYTGITGNSTVSEAVGYEAKARMMSLSPFLTSEQSKEIVMGTLKAGYNGKQADTVMDFVAQNVKRGVVSVDQSIGLYKTAISGAGDSTEALTGHLEDLEKAAARTSGSVQDVMSAFEKGLKGLVAEGATGALPADVSSILSEAYSGAGLGDWDGTGVLQTVQGQNAIGRLLDPTGGINQGNFFTEITARGISGTEVARKTQEYYKNLIKQYLPQYAFDNMTYKDAQKIPEQPLRTFAAVMLAMGIFTPEIANNLAKVRKFIAATMGYKNSVESVIAREDAELGTMNLDENLNDTVREAVGGDWSTNQTAGERLQWGSEGWAEGDYTNDADIAELAYKAMLEGGQYIPAVEKWINSDKADDTIIEHPVTGDPVFLSDYLNELAPNDPTGAKRIAIMQAVASGKIRTAIGDYGQLNFLPDFAYFGGNLRQQSLESVGNEIKWNEGGLPQMEGVLSEVGAYNPQTVRIELDPKIEKWFRIFTGELPWPNYTGPNDSPITNSGETPTVRGVQ